MRFTVAVSYRQSGQLAQHGREVCELVGIELDALDRPELRQLVRQVGEQTIANIQLPDLGAGIL
jgi:hypothetical protein